MPAVKHTWQVIERHLIHIGLTEYNLSHTDLASIFAHNFSGGFWPKGLPNSNSLRDEYNSRYKDGRSTQWANHIERDSYTADQERDRQMARDKIQAAAQALGIPITWTALPPTATSATSATAAPSVAAQTAPVSTVSGSRATANRPPTASISIRASRTGTLKRKAMEQEPHEPLKSQKKHHTIFEGGLGEPPKNCNPSAVTGVSSRTASQAEGEEEQVEPERNSLRRSGLAADQTTSEAHGRKKPHSLPTRRSSRDGPLPTSTTGAMSARRAKPTTSKNTASAGRGREGNALTRLAAISQQRRQTPVHDGPTFEQYQEQQARTNPLHPHHPRNLAIRQQQPDASEASSEMFRLLAAILPLILTPEQQQTAVHNLNAEIQRRRRLEGSDAADEEGEQGSGGGDNEEGL